jgi:hypothetical protein
MAYDMNRAATPLEALRCFRLQRLNGHSRGAKLWLGAELLREMNAYSFDRDHSTLATSPGPTSILLKRRLGRA